MIWAVRDYDTSGVVLISSFPITAVVQANKIGNHQYCYCYCFRSIPFISLDRSHYLMREEIYSMGVALNVVSLISMEHIFLEYQGISPSHT